LSAACRSGASPAALDRRHSDDGLSAIDVDRNGERFVEKMAPDETIDDAVPAVALGTINDPVVAAATQWISRQPSCRQRPSLERHVSRNSC